MKVKPKMLTLILLTILFIEISAILTVKTNNYSKKNEEEHKEINITFPEFKYDKAYGQPYATMYIYKNK